MVQTLGKFHKHLPESKDKDNLKKLINMLMYSTELIKIMKFVDKRIAESMKTTDRHTKSEFSQKLWGKVRRVIADTYDQNKEIDNDKS